MRENNNTYLRLLQAAEKVCGTLSKELGDNLVAAYVYGSVARGDYLESSDVDLHIVLRDYAQAGNIPHTSWVGNVPVGVSPHSLSFYEIPPEWLLGNIDVAAVWEGLWELEKIIVLHDPGSIVSSFKEKIAPVINNQLLLKARANISFKVAMTEAAEVKKNLSEGALDQALVHMYALGGGDSYSGAAVQVLKAVVKFSGVPLTVRRIWLRFKEACQKIDAPDIISLMEDCYGMDQLNEENLQRIVDEACLVAKSLVPKVTIYDLERFRLAFTEFMEIGETEAAYVYMLGSFSATYLELDSEGWQKPVRLKLKELMYKTAGLHSQKELENRVRIMLKAMNDTRKEWLSC